MLPEQTIPLQEGFWNFSEHENHPRNIQMKIPGSTPGQFQFHSQRQNPGSELSTVGGVDKGDLWSTF